MKLRSKRKRGPVARWRSVLRSRSLWAVLGALLMATGVALLAFSDGGPPGALYLIVVGAVLAASRLPRIRRRGSRRRVRRRHRRGIPVAALDGVELVQFRCPDCKKPVEGTLPTTPGESNNVHCGACGLLFPIHRNGRGAPFSSRHNAPAKSPSDVQ